MNKNTFLIFSLLLLLFSYRTLAVEDIVFKGTLIVDSLAYKASFELIKKGDRYSQMKIFPESSKTFCYFDVKKITAPQQTRGRGGVIFVNKPKKCTFIISSKNESLVWNSVSLIDFSYYLNVSMELEGTSKLSSIQKSYRALLNFD